MKQVIRTTFLFLMLAVFLIGTTGVSFYVHECRSSHKKEIVAFPEIINHPVSCCCAGEVTGSVQNDEPVSSFNEPACCKNTHVYRKASFNGFPVFYQFSTKLIQTAIPANFLSLQNSVRGADIISFTPRVDHPPPRSGRILVHFLQQIKIPAHVS
jgi:hypothetical protein